MNDGMNKDKMNTLFDGILKSDATKNKWDVNSVSSLEEVAMHLKNNDEEYRYEYFLVERVYTQKGHPLH